MFQWSLRTKVCKQNDSPQRIYEVQNQDPNREPSRSEAYATRNAMRLSRILEP